MEGQQAARSRGTSRAFPRVAMATLVAVALAGCDGERSGDATPIEFAARVQHGLAGASEPYPEDPVEFADSASAIVEGFIVDVEDASSVPVEPGDPAAGEFRFAYLVVQPSRVYKGDSTLDSYRIGIMLPSSETAESLRDILPKTTRSFHVVSSVRELVGTGRADEFVHRTTEHFWLEGTDGAALVVGDVDAHAGIPYAKLVGDFVRESGLDVEN